MFPGKSLHLLYFLSLGVVSGCVLAECLVQVHLTFSLPFLLLGSDLEQEG